jgi:hypothetical protein
MLQLFRVVLLPLLLCVLSMGVQANGSFRDCPSVANYRDNTSPVDLIWNVSASTTSGVAGGELSLLFAAPLASDSGCQIEGEVEL